ncbi:MAG: Fic family protein [Rickettsiales bacterium]
MSITNFKSGKLVQRYQYKSFEPNLLNTKWMVDNAELQFLLSQADIKLGELNAFSQLIPDVDFFIKMHILKEGTKSSKIEGTQTNIDDAVQKKEYIEAEKKDDWLEVHNYVEAMNSSIKALDKLPLSNRLLKQTHKSLMRGVRGNRKTPGEFRKSQNWIGGASLRDAIFIPPHESGVDDLMADLEKFLHNENLAIPHLIKIGIAHYQFETIHPFLDGNGRIGRLLITLYLVSNNLLAKPTLYLSDFFEKHRSLYYDNLTRVRTNDDLVQWLKFFLEGVRHTSENSIQTFKNIIKLRDDTEAKIAKLGKKQDTAREFLQYLYSNPIVDSTDVVKLFNINLSTALRLIGDFVKLKILKEFTGKKRNQNFVFEGYLKLFR